jgi:hypothetical protein
MRDQQTLLSDYLKKSAEARQRAHLAMEQEAERLKASEREAAQALRDAKAAEARALAAATRAAEERRLAAKSPAATPASQPDKAAVGEPMQLHQAAGAMPPPFQTQPQSPPPPAPATTAAAQSNDDGVMATLRNTVTNTVTTIERLPSRVLSGWFSDAVPPRPPTDLPQRHFMKAAM